MSKAAVRIGECQPPEPHRRRRRGYAPLDRYLTRVQAAECFSRRTERAVAEEIRRLEADRWLALFSDPRDAETVDTALLAAMAEGSAEGPAVATAVARFRNTAPSDARSAGALLLTAIAAADPHHRLFDRLFRRLDQTPDLEAILHPDTIWTIEKLSACVEGTTHRLITANLRHVVAVARRYDFGLLPLADLIQEGNLGLMDAARRFDPTRGVRLKTFASKFIKHDMRKALASKGRTVRIPDAIIDAHYRLRQTAERFWTRFGRDPSHRELAEAMGMSEKELTRLRNRAPLKPVSLEQQAPGQPRSFIESIVDEAAGTPEAALHFGRWRREMSRVLGVLSRLERRIIVWRFGLEGNDTLSFRQIGQRCNLSGERIRQMQNIALRKMRLAFCPELE